MDEYVAVATIPSNEAVALLGVEPFHGAGLFDCRIGRWSVRFRRLETGSAWGRGNSRARINAHDLGDVWPFVAGTNTNFENVAGLYHPEPILGQHGSMQECVAGPIGEFDKAKSFSGLNHLTTPWTGGSEGASNRLWLNRGLFAKARC